MKEKWLLEIGWIPNKLDSLWSPPGSWNCDSSWEIKIEVEAGIRVEIEVEAKAEAEVGFGFALPYTISEIANVNGGGATANFGGPSDGDGGEDLEERSQSHVMWCVCEW